MVRLGLNEDWIEVLEDDDGGIAESFTPLEPPPFPQSIPTGPAEPPVIRMRLLHACE
jgi:hypothetical protein